MEKFKHLYNFGDIVKIQITKKTIRVGIIVGMVFSTSCTSVIYKCHSNDGEVCHCENENVVKNSKGCLFIDGHDGRASVYFDKIDTKDTSLTAIKQYALRRWNELWNIIPDADKKDMTKKDIQNLGRFMEIEKLNEFLEKL